MPVPARCACQVLRSTDTYTLGGGKSRTPSTSAATQNLPFVGPTQLVGCDATPFTIALSGGSSTITLPFYNLPLRTHGNVITSPSVLQPFRNTPPKTFIQPMSTLLYEVQPMNIVAPAGVRIDCTPDAIDSNGIVCPGPFLGGGRSYNNFRVHVTASTTNKTQTGKITGYVIGRLHLSSG